MKETHYLNFDLIVERSGEDYRAFVVDSPLGQAEHVFSWPFTDEQLEIFYLRVGRPRGRVRRLDSPEMHIAKDYGEKLFESVFSGDVATSLLSSLITAKNEGAGLRIRLRIQTPELNELPWEFLYNARQGRFLSLSEDTPIIRFIDLPYPPDTLLVQPPLRVLVMISSPEGWPRLEIDQEWSRLQRALDPLIQRGLVQMDLIEKATLLELERALRRKEYHIFHFIGHGGFDEGSQDGVLVFENENKAGKPWSGQHMGHLLNDHRTLRLAVLNACEGARTGREDVFAGVAYSLVQQGLPAVIAMQFEITDQSAIIFSQEFYTALADGLPVDNALNRTRKAIFASGNDIEWGTPVLFTRTPDGRIFNWQEIPAIVSDHSAADEPTKVLAAESHEASRPMETSPSEIYPTGIFQQIRNGPIWFMVGGLILVILLFASWIGNSNWNLSAGQAPLIPFTGPSASPTTTETPIPTRTITLTWTPSQATTASPTVEPPTFEPGVIFQDDFSSNANGWLVGAQTSASSYGAWSFSNGKYRLEMTSRDNAARWSRVPGVAAGDFALWFDASFAETKGDFSSGHPAVRVSFRESSDGYYLVYFDDNAFKLRVNQSGTWNDILDWTHNSAIRLASPATTLLGVIAKGSTFQFFADGQKLGEVTDMTFTGPGEIYIGAILFEADQSLTLEFDNLEIREVQ